MQSMVEGERRGRSGCGVPPPFFLTLRPTSAGSSSTAAGHFHARALAERPIRRSDAAMATIAPPEPIRSVVIVGGGTAGWMAAAALAHHFRNAPIRFTLIESSEIGAVGVGEATIPTIRRFYAALGMSDAQVMKACNATAKLGIRFNDWLRPGHSFVHPFGRFGQDLNGVDFHHYWLAARTAGDTAPLGD